MLKQLKFVQGSVGKLGDENALEHFQIKAGRVTGYNGIMSISAPIALDIDCQPNGKQLIQAIAKCEDQANLTLMKSGKLKVTSGKFKVLVDCHPEGLPLPLPEGKKIDLVGGILIDALKILVKFVGQDKTHPWSNGVLLKGSSAYATLNGAIIEYWLGHTEARPIIGYEAMPFPVNLPLACVKELIRIGEQPSMAMVTPKAISFHYEDGSWIQTSTLMADWPDVSLVLGRANNATPFPPSFFEALDAVKPFVDALQRVYLLPDMLATTPNANDAGASYASEGVLPGGVFQWQILNMLRGIADKVDFGAYPKPCLFYGDRLRGAIMGMRG